MMKAIGAAIVGAALLGSSIGLTAQSKTVSANERLDVLKRAQVWTQTDVRSMDLRVGPEEHGFRVGETVNCTYVEKKFGGRTPKFACARDSKPKDVLKVRYGADNGEVYAGVAATRLLWALGFGADAVYPVRVVCRGCPDQLKSAGKKQGDSIVFDVAAIERPFDGEDVEARGVDEGWSWKELDQVDQNAGGAPPAQRDALKLLAAFIQHSDNKAQQQRLVCLSGGKTREELAGCDMPFMMIHDLGVTFGRANLFNKATIGSVNLEEWSKAKIWKDQERCVANLAQSQTGTLDDPVISEGGRGFLSDLLARLSDRQISDMFASARFAEKPSGGAPIASWVDTFKKKRAEIASAHCPRP